MKSTRERSLSAAIELLGELGVRGLTHTRVDDRAGLARGSTSNHFRTRTALLTGAINEVAARELADFDPGLPSPRTPDQLVDTFTALIEVQTTTHRTRTAARYALFLESMSHETLRRPLVENRMRFEAWTTEVVTALGAANPRIAAQTLMACADGLILHHLTVDATTPMRPAVQLLVRAVVPPMAP